MVLLVLYTKQPYISYSTALSLQQQFLCDELIRLDVVNQNDVIHVYKNHLIMYSWLTSEIIWKTMCLQFNQNVIFM